MLRNAERPRVAVLLAILAVLGAIALAGVGVLVGKSSVDKGVPREQLTQARAANAATERELRALRTDLQARVAKLQRSARGWRARTQRAERALRRWQSRARRAERRARVRAATRRSQQRAQTASTTSRRRTPARAAAPPPPPPTPEFPF